MNHKKNLMAAAFVTAAITTTPVFAMDMKPYVGLDYNHVSVNYKNNIDASDVFDDTLNGVNPYVGVRFHENLSTEFGYFSTGTAENTFDGSAFVGGGAGDTSEIKFKGVHLDLVGNFPVADRFDVLGSVGLARIDAEETTVIGGTSSSSSESQTAFRLGLGGHYALTESLGLRSMARLNVASWDADSLNEEAISNIWQISAGLQYRF